MLVGKLRTVTESILKVRRKEFFRLLLGWETMQTVVFVVLWYAGHLKTNDGIEESVDADSGLSHDVAHSERES